MSDIDRIISYMEENHSITCKECEKKIGTTELRRRIRDIKDRGYEIGDVWEDGENRVGVKTRYKRYFIIKSPVGPKKDDLKKEEKTQKKTFEDLFSGIFNLTIFRKKDKLTKKEKNNDL